VIRRGSGRPNALLLTFTASNVKTTVPVTNTKRGIGQICAETFSVVPRRVSRTIRIARPSGSARAIATTADLPKSSCCKRPRGSDLRRQKPSEPRHLSPRRREEQDVAELGAINFKVPSVCDRDEPERLRNWRCTRACEGDASKQPERRRDDPTRGCHQLRLPRTVHSIHRTMATARDWRQPAFGGPVFGYVTRSR
jgi:hypothetical protein